MMHTFEYYDRDTATDISIHHNSDLSGNCVIAMQSPRGTTGTFELPAEALLNFVLRYLSTREISAIESMDYPELLKHFTGSDKR